MLVLSRKKNQSVVIDHQVEIEVLQIKGNTVRLGINAPRDIKILRGELQPVPVSEITIPISSQKFESSAINTKAIDTKAINPKAVSDCATA